MHLKAGRKKREADKLSQKIALSLILTVIIITLITQLVGSVSFISSPSISPSPAYTANDLNCSWRPSADVTQTNVSWYRDGILFLNLTATQNYSILPYQNTSKNENWVCNVTITNTTTTITETIARSITNSPPDEPDVYNTSGQDLGSFEVIAEDQIYNYDINSTDPDGDTLSYRVSPVASFCTVNNPNTGAVTCSPTASDLGPGNTIGQENITFWADDTDPFFPTSKGHTVLFNITPVNDNPQISPALVDQNISEGETFNYAINGADEENNTPFNFTINVTPSLALVINITSNTTALIMFENNRTAFFTEGGNYTVNVTIYDNQSANSMDSFNLEIIPVNAPPVLETITIQNSSQGSSITFYTYADDANVNDTLVFNMTPTSCTFDNPWNISTLNNSNNATGLVNISNLNNTHVVCRNVRITVIDDKGAEDFQDVFLNISNTNDPPNVEVLSSYFNNTNGGNISSLVSYAESPFIYKVNATDIDNLTYEGEILSFGDNSSFLNISSTTGIISFIPTQGDIGNHTINITVADDEGLIDNRIMNFEIKNNSAPVFIVIGNYSCLEDNTCYVPMEATDADGDNLTFTSNNTIVFNVVDNSSQSPVTSATVNYTPNQSMLGNYSILVTVTDIRGAYDMEIVYLSINNSNDPPVVEPFSIPTIVELHSVSVYVQADDEDYDLPGTYSYIPVNVSNTTIYVTEYVTFNVTNVSGKSMFTLNTSFNASNNRTYTRIVFIPQIGDAGIYSVNISATDYNNVTNWTIENFTVLARSERPNITTIRPYGRPYSAQTVFSFTNTSNFPSNLTTINFSENRSVLYNLIVTDDLTAAENMTYGWYINGTLNSTGTSLSLSYGFFTQGTYNVTVIAWDDMYENSSWTWNVTVDDLNRKPLLLNPLRNMSLGANTVYTDYLKKTTGVHFLDPDDDLNSNSDFDVGETSLLNYTVTACSVANITFSGTSIAVNPVQVGTCTVTFTALDYGNLSNTSNIVLINVTDVPNASQETEDPVPSSGGGGGRSRSVVIPISKEEENPQTIEIIVPELVTVYENRTVLIPVTIQNNWNNSLYNVWINASTNSSSVELEFTENRFQELIPGEKRNITLMVGNYRLGENYEVRLVANVTNPKVSDTAVVMLNSIEQSEAGEDVETKVTFAQDLLNDNPECLELNELLMQAREELKTGSRVVADKIVSGVIEGCKYLVSISKKTEQRPESIVTKFVRKENLKYLLIFFGLVVLTILIVLIVKKEKASALKKGKEEKEGEEAKEEEVKPYWTGPG